MARDERAHEVLVVTGEPPDTQRVRLAVSPRGGGEVLRDPREEEPRVPAARRLGDRPALDEDRARAVKGEVVRGRDPGDAAADDRDVRGRVPLERRVGLCLQLVEPDAPHVGYCASGRPGVIRQGEVGWG